MAKKTDHLVVTLQVKWDTDGQRGLELPKELNVHFPFNSEYYNKTFSELHDEANDVASNNVGWCIKSSHIVQVAIKKL